MSNSRRPTTEEKAKLFSQFQKTMELTNEGNRDPQLVSRLLQSIIGRKRDNNAYILPRNILGKDFISPNEVEKYRPVVYSTEQLEELEQTIPPKEELKLIKDNKMTLMPSPPEGMNFLEIINCHPELFKSETIRWCSIDKEQRAFSAIDKTSFGWLAVRKKKLPDSSNERWKYQEKMVPSELRIPNIAEVAWVITTYQAVRNDGILHLDEVRTSSIGSNGSHVRIQSYFGAVNLYGASDDSRIQDVGIAVAWKL